jgi:hypothetical protein
MRYLVLLLLIPFPAYARDINIDINFVIRQEHIRPEPKIVHPRSSVHIVLHSDGSVSDSTHVTGKLGKDFKSNATLGDSRFQVVDEHTIRRTWHNGVQERILTIKANDPACTANLELKMPPGVTEFRARAADFNAMAEYRNSEVESIDCRIE